jgi:polygalacturonase
MDGTLRLVSLENDPLREKTNMYEKMDRRAAMQWIGGGGASLAIAAAMGAGAPSPVPSLLVNVREFGARGDGKFLDSPAIQAAVDRCAAAGGGTVVLPAGVYLSGTVFLKSRVALWFQPGSVLLGSTELRHYPPVTPRFRSYTDVNYVERSLIHAERAEDVALFGQGVINGQGEAQAFQLPGDREHFKQRPYLLRMIECERVSVCGLTLRNSPMWVQHYLACDDVVIDGVTVQSRVNINNDGLDIDGCSRVRVSNCSIISGDDGICLKSTGPRPCRAIAITNCYISSLCSAFKFGTESTAGFFDIAFSNSVIEDTRLAGIALETVDGGTLDGVSIDNIRMRRVRGGIFVRLGNRGRPYLAEGPGGAKGTYRAPPGTPVPGVGALRNVRISNVAGDGCEVTGCAIAGLSGHPVEQIELDGIQLEFVGGGRPADIDREVPEKETAYPNHTMFGRLPAYGLYCRHVRGLRLRDVQLALASPDARPGLVCHDVQDLDVRGWRGASLPAPAAAEILLRETQDAWIHGSRAAGGAVFARVSGKGSRDLRFSGNWCRSAARLVSSDADVPAEAVITEK